MKSRDESDILRRRADRQRDSLDQGYQGFASPQRSDFYRVTVGVGPFPTTGLNTVFMVQLWPEQTIGDIEGSITPNDPAPSDPKFPAINLGDCIPLQDQTVVWCTAVDGQLFFTFRGKGVATV